MREDRLSGYELGDLIIVMVIAIASRESRKWKNQTYYDLIKIDMAAISEQ